MNKNKRQVIKNSENTEYQEKPLPYPKEQLTDWNIFFQTVFNRHRMPRKLYKKILYSGYSPGDLKSANK